MTTRGFFTPQELERRANLVLQKHAAKSTGSLSIPIPVERIAEHTLNLELLWDVILEPEDRSVLAKLIASKRRIVFNETHRDLLTETPGLYNTSLGHEVGHWILHVDEGAVDTLPLPGFETSGELVVYHDSRWNEENAARFMSYLLMPREFLTPIIQNLDQSLQDWQTVYRLREKFDVTISAMRIRLERLGLLHMDEEGKLYHSRESFAGQMGLKFG